MTAMSELRPCPQCRRHTRVDEMACPFCATSLRESGAPTLPVGRFARAAVFAGAMVASACGGAQKVDEQAQGPPPGSEADAGAPDAAQPPVQVVPDHDVPMPYGAPPARRRLV
jgi:hypothetical protein